MSVPQQKSGSVPSPARTAPRFCSSCGLVITEAHGSEAECLLALRTTVALYRAALEPEPGTPSEAPSASAPGPREAGPRNSKATERQNDGHGHERHPERTTAADADTSAR